MKISALTGEGVIELYYPAQEDRIRSLMKAGFRCFDYNFIPMYREKILLQDHWKENLAGTRNLIEEAGIFYGQAHAPGFPATPQDFLDDEHSWDPIFAFQLKRVFDCCKYLEIPYLVTHPFSTEGNSREQFLEHNHRFFQKWIPLMEQAGIMVLLENVGVSPNGPYYVGCGADLAMLIDTLGHPLFGACWDTGHANIQLLNEPQYDSILALGHRLKALHVHDNLTGLLPDTACTDLHLSPFLGTVNYDAILTGLLEIGYEGTFSLESVHYTDLRSQKPFVKNGIPIERLRFPSLELIEDADRHQYLAAKYILSQYHCYEY